MQKSNKRNVADFLHFEIYFPFINKHKATITYLCVCVLL